MGVVLAYYREGRGLKGAKEKFFPVACVIVTVFPWEIRVLFLTAHEICPYILFFYFSYVIGWEKVDRCQVFTVWSLE